MSAIRRIPDPVFRGLKLLFRPEAQRICKLMRLSLHRTALLFWCRLFRYFRAASHGKGWLALPAVSGSVFSRFWQFCGRRSMLLFSIQSFALYFFVELILRTTGVELKPMEWMPTRLSTFALTAATFGLICLIVALGLLQTQRSRHLIFQVPALIFHHMPYTVMLFSDFFSAV